MTANVPTQTCSLCGAEWVTVHSCPVTPTVTTPLIGFDIVPPAQERTIKDAWRAYNEAMVDGLIAERDQLRVLLYQAITSASDDPADYGVLLDHDKGLAIPDKNGSDAEAPR